MAFRHRWFTKCGLVSRPGVLFLRHFLQLANAFGCSEKSYHTPPLLDLQWNVYVILVLPLRSIAHLLHGVRGIHNHAHFAINSAAQVRRHLGIRLFELPIPACNVPGLRVVRNGLHKLHDVCLHQSLDTCLGIPRLCYRARTFDRRLKVIESIATPNFL